MESAEKLPAILPAELMPKENRHSIARLFTYMTWIAILGLFYLLFEDQLLQRQNPNHNLSLVRTSEPVVLKRNRQGHYIAPGTINGVKVTLLLDTGATEVSVPGKLAEHIGLQPGRASYASTANGNIQVFDTRLDSVSLGGLVMENVNAHINPYMQGNTVLLGMSFMQHLEITQRGDTLTLKY